MVFLSRKRWEKRGNKTSVFGAQYYSPFLLNRPHLDQFAEDIAETFHIDLVDETGVKPILRKRGMTDISLINQLKNQNYPGFSGVLPPNLERIFKTKDKTNKLIIENRKKVWTPLTYFALALTGMSLLAVLFLKTNLGVLIIGIILYFISLERTSIEITNEVIVAKKRNFLRQTYSHMIKTYEVEFLHTVKAWGDYNIEFVADRGRVPIPGAAKKEDLEDFINIIKSMMVEISER